MTDLPRRDLAQSNAQFQRAVKRLPLGIVATFRQRGDDRRIDVSHGRGGRTFDIDGTASVGGRPGYGPSVPGHAEDCVDGAEGRAFTHTAEREPTVASLFRPEISRALERLRRGLHILPGTDDAVFTQSGGDLVMFRDRDACHSDVVRHPARDAEPDDLCPRNIQRRGRIIRPMQLHTPRAPSRVRPKDIRRLLWVGKQIGTPCEQQCGNMALCRTLSISDLHDGYVENPGLRSHFAVTAISSTASGAMGPCSACVLRHPDMNEVDVGAWGFDWMADFDKGPLTGRRARAGLDIAGNVAADGALPDHSQKHEMGHGASAAWSPIPKRSLALAEVEARHARGHDMRVAIQVERALHQAKLMPEVAVLDRPLGKPARTRATSTERL